jgi:site-specific DNA-methyltransferase (adenine-specific)
MSKIILGDNLAILPQLSSKSVRLCYLDPPFNSQKVQKRDRITVKAIEDGKGDRIGFGGKSYETIYEENTPSYNDKFDDFEAFLMPRIEACLHTLTDDATIIIHLDYREVHYIKCAMDRLIGRDKFCNEIIWSFDWGARSKTKWPCKHNNLLVFTLNPKNYVFNYDAMDRLPYLSGAGLVSEEKLKRGKTPTDVWQMTIIPTNSHEKTRTGNYPTAKPAALLERIVKVHSNIDDYILDFFAGSGTTGEAAAKHNRNFIMIDQNPDACNIMANRLKNYNPEKINF